MFNDIFTLFETVARELRMNRPVRWCGPVLFLAAILVLVLVFWTKMLFSFSHILVTYKRNSFSQVLVDESTKRF